MIRSYRTRELRVAGLECRSMLLRQVTRRFRDQRGSIFCAPDYLDASRSRVPAGRSDRDGSNPDLSSMNCRAACVLCFLRICAKVSEIVFSLRISRNSVELSFALETWLQTPARGFSRDDRPISPPSELSPFINESARSPQTAAWLLRIETYVGTVEELSGEMTASGLRAGQVELALLLSEGETVRAIID